MTEWTQLVEIFESKIFAAWLGLISHFIFCHVDLDFEMYIVLPLIFSAFLSATYTVYVADDNVNSAIDAFAVMIPVALTYISALFGSMVIYRVFLHRLRKFPGPRFAKVTEFYNAWLAYPKMHYFRKAEALHKTYGDYIRLGPRHLSIADVESIPVIHGPASKCMKGPWYGGSLKTEGGASLHQTMDKKNHRDRRRVWDNAFNVKALRDYEPRINRHTIELLDQLRERDSEPVRISNWFNFYSFDVMGDVAFSRSFGMLSKGTEDQLIADLHASMAPAGFFRNIVWALSLLLHIPAAQNELKKFVLWTHTVLKDRQKRSPAESDIFSWLIEPDAEDISADLNADSRLVIVAGSDTTASTLTWLFYELCLNPDQVAKAQEAIDKIAKGRDFVPCEDLSSVPHLDGCINEALRMYPAVPSGVQRETPKEGIIIRDRYIPGRTLIWTPTYTIQRDERYFPQGNKFMPERWTTKPDMVKDKRAFIPFSTGAYNCIGQRLAMMEMRVVTANILLNFDVTFADNEDGQSVLLQSRDCFTWTMGKLDVTLKRRKRANS